MKLYAYIFSPLPESESSDIIKDQKKIIEQYCENNSYKLIKYYIDYNGNEYKKIKQQKQLAKLLYDIQKGYGLITCNINSLNFNITIVIDIMEKLKIKGVYLIDPMSNYDNYKNKDDILDCCAYALQIRNEYWALVRNLKTVQRNSNPSLIYFNNTPF